MHVLWNERASVTEIHFEKLFELLCMFCTFKWRGQWIPKFNSGYQGSTITSHASGSMTEIRVLIKNLLYSSKVDESAVLKGAH